MTPKTPKKYKSRFNKLVRIKQSQLNWLQENKGDNGCRTMAGFLDKIINNFKDTSNE